MFLDVFLENQKRIFTLEESENVFYIPYGVARARERRKFRDIEVVQLPSSQKNIIRISFQRDEMCVYITIITVCDVMVGTAS